MSTTRSYAADKGEPNFLVIHVAMQEESWRLEPLEFKVLLAFCS